MSHRHKFSAETGHPWLGCSPSEHRCNMEDFIVQKQQLLKTIDSTRSLLSDLRRFSKQDWVFRYPVLDKQHSPREGSLASSSSLKFRRSLSFADSPSLRSDVVLTPKRNGMARSITLASIVDAKEGAAHEDTHADETLNDDFHLLRLELKLGTHGPPNSSPETLVSQLGTHAIANLLDQCMVKQLSHIDKLSLRVQDKSSKVLVTGDLNAGKSTFVNALLGREVMPVDQQPCTTAFCEVHNAAENDGQEEVHILKEGATYSIQDDSTFERAKIEDLEQIFADYQGSLQPVLKIYLSDSRTSSESFLANGVVDISLIDAPGLNRDSIKTTALFARQEEIDVVVFVVSAENHFTLSAKEFLISASAEKAYFFIVVNKYEQIRNKAKCQQLVFEQLEQLSPETFRDRSELVHFVDSAAALDSAISSTTFNNLESSLRSFVFAQRSKSKLQPARTYIRKLLADIELLAGTNIIIAGKEFEGAKADLERVKPVLEQMVKVKDAMEEALEQVEESGASVAAARTKAILQDALDCIGRGTLPAHDIHPALPSYPGVFGVWEYARDVRRAFVSGLHTAVRMAEGEARATTASGVRKIADLSGQYLPEGVARNKRVFIPEAMFNVGKKSRRSGALVAGSLGLGVAQRADLLETTFADICDIHRLFWLHFGDHKAGSLVDEELSPSALSLAGVAAGTLALVGGQVVGVRGFIEGVLWSSEVLGNDNTRQWLLPVVAAGVIGYGAYLVSDLPNSIPRTVGRRVRRSMLVSDSGEMHDEWLDVNARRVSCETRKVLRIASYDLKKRFRDALEERGQEVSRNEEVERRALKAKEWIEKALERTAEVRAQLAVA